MIDQDAWNELSDLYLSEQEYTKAAFCIEELILQNPHNHLFFLRFAEIKHTQVCVENSIFYYLTIIIIRILLSYDFFNSQGGYENLELAMAYYCQALKLSPSNMRALFGLYLVNIFNFLTVASVSYYREILMPVVYHSRPPNICILPLNVTSTGKRKSRTLCPGRWSRYKLSKPLIHSSIVSVYGSFRGEKLSIFVISGMIKYRNRIRRLILCKISKI